MKDIPLQSIADYVEDQMAREDYDAAIDRLKKLAVLSKQRFGDNAEELRWPLERLSVCYLATEDYAKAEKYARRALAIGEKIHGQCSPEYLGGLSILSNILDARDRLEEAREVNRQGLQLARGCLPPDHELVSMFIHNATNPSDRFEEHDYEALLADRVLSKVAELYPDAHQGAQAVKAMIRFYDERETRETAWLCALRHIQDVTQWYGPSHLVTADALALGGRRAMELEDYEAARECLEKERSAREGCQRFCEEEYETCVERLGLIQLLEEDIAEGYG